MSDTAIELADCCRILRCAQVFSLCIIVTWGSALTRMRHRKQNLNLAFCSVSKCCCYGFVYICKTVSREFIVADQIHSDTVAFKKEDGWLWPIQIQIQNESNISI